DFSAILSNSPVEINDGFIVADRDDGDVFASIVFKNVGAEKLKRLNIQLWCYLNQNIPYCKLDFSYMHEDLTFGLIRSGGSELRLRESNRREYIGQNECFGSCVYLKLPESYFTKLEVYIDSVENDKGEKTEVGVVAGGSVRRYQDLDNISKLVYTRVNIYGSAEHTHPAVVIPQETNTAWLCCCGNKNPRDAEFCGVCNRERDWQLNNITEEALEEKRTELNADPTERVMHDKSGFRQDKYLETDDEIAAKVERYEQAMKNIAEEEKQRKNYRRKILKRIIIAIIIAVAIYLAVYWINNDLNYQTILADPDAFLT
ncbi:MAG: hypothetical protein J5760_02865, partial [Clostridia bacterium]|nr:hypothetical protein [Clostridia bacterium]